MMPVGSKSYRIFYLFMFALKPLAQLFFVGVLLITMTACGSKEESASADVSYNTIEWTDLMPASDLEALMNPPEFLDSIVDGSAEDQIDSQIQTTLEQAPATDYERALVSADVVPEFDSSNIRLPGFVVPLEFDENSIVTE